MTRRALLKYSFVKSIPIMCSYLFLGIAYGILMEKAGFKWYYSLFVSLTVYTGAFQFVLTSLLAIGTPLVTIAVTAFFMNSRQFFYALSYVDEFNHMGRRKPYMIFSLTDETYAVNFTLDITGKDRQDALFYIALFSYMYWSIGAVAGGVLGLLIPFSTEGIDFCMTALFVIIFIDQWEKTDSHVPALTGIVIGLAGLLIFGEDRFMLPALLTVSAILVFFNSRRDTPTEDKS